jgi:hypothetical protein
MQNKGRKLIKQRTLLLALTLGVILSQAGFGPAQGASPAKPSVPKGWKFSFPDGDPKAGKTVFMNMQCYSCHAIQIPGENAVRAEGIGPELTGYSAFLRILSRSSKPHRGGSAGICGQEGKASRATITLMTIQEMIDLVAFFAWA